MRLSITEEDSSETVPSPAAKPPNPTAVIAVLAFAGMGASFMQTILVPIQSSLPDLLNSSREDAAWVITITLLASAICTPVAGKLGDMYGKRRVAMALLLILICGSVLCALSSGVAPMIVGRGLQGAGMGVIPLGIAILRDTVPRDRLPSAIALVSATLGVGGAIGLPVSALVTEHFDWHALFWVATAIGLTAFLLYLLVIPPSPMRAGGRLDIGGTIGLAIGLSGVLLGLSKGNDWGWLSPIVVGSILGGVLTLLAWTWYELRQKNPLVNLRLSGQRPVLMTNLASLAMGFALFASTVVFPQLLQLPALAGGLGIPLLQASLVLMPSGIAMLAMSPVAGYLTGRIGPKWLLISGAAIIAAVYATALLIELSLIAVLCINISIGIGIGLGYAAMPTLIMRSVPASESGAANGLNTLMRSLGTATAAAVVAMLLASSSSTTGPTEGLPTAAGFDLALAFGLGAALICCTLALFIPQPRHGASTGR